ncbi:MAG: hypothetical protein R3E76_02825 [Planctomycetota bacterium]
MRISWLSILAAFLFLAVPAALSAQADHLTITTVPSTVQANATFTIVVEARDAGNAVDTGYSTNVTLARNGGSGTLGGTLTVAATAGVATFNNLTLDTISTTVTIDATSGALTPDTSTTISVTADRLIITAQPGNAAANATISTVSVAARDGNGNTDTSFTGNIAVALNSGSGALSGTTPVAATAGVADFTDLSINAIGTKDLIFTSTGLSAATSSSFDISADRLVFTTQPVNTTAGQTMANVVVEARDGLGTTDTAFTGSVALTIASGTGSLNGTTSIAAASGVATFSTLSINEADAFTLDADFGTLTTGTSSSFTINPDADAAVVFVVQPSSVVVSTQISPAITAQIQDQFGNNTTSTASVTLAINNNPGGATLGGTTTVAATSGLATFSDITLDAAGTGYTLDATSTGLTSDTSSAFNVTANPAPTFTVSGGGGGVTSGGTINVLTGSTVAAANISIQVNDSSTGDSLTLTAGITNVGTTGILQSEFEGSSTSPTAINANPTTGTFNAVTTHVVTLTANDGVNTAVVFTFSIVVSNAPTITVVGPNGGENFVVGGNMTVTWSSAGVAGTVDILLSTNSGGAFSTTLISATANDGTETITVPNNPATTCRVRVRDTANPGTTLDDSDADFTIAVPAPAAGTLSASGNPGTQNANPGSTRSALGFRITETGGASTLTVTGVTVRVTMFNNTGGLAEAAVSSISLRRGSTLLATQTSAGWTANATTITCNFTGLSEAITASGTGDFTVSMTFAGTTVPTPNPSYSAQVTTADISSASTISGTTVTGGTITLIDSLPSDPLDEDNDDDSCDLASHGGPAWPLALAVLFAFMLALRRRRETI